MADIQKPAFRATYGLDAANEKVINVAKADYAVLDDGVNVEFFIEENTIQQYDATRWYKKDFAVIYDNRIWVSQVQVGDESTPAGAFQELYWKAVRTDPKWLTVNTPAHSLKSGEYISVDSAIGPTEFLLPGQPQDGDTIVIKDIGGRVGYNKVNIKISNHELVRFGVKANNVLISKPFAYCILIFSNKLWQFWEAANEERGIRAEPGHGLIDCQASDYIMRRYTSAAPITLRLPKYANQGDIIKTVDIDNLAPLYHMTVQTFDASTSIGQPGTTSMEFRTSGDGFFVYNEASATWIVWDGDLRTRVRVVVDDVKLLPNESVIVFGNNNATPQTINLTFPTGVADGDTVRIALNYLRKLQTVNIKAAVGDKIATSVKLLEFPKRSEYPPDMDWVLVDSLTFKGETNYSPILEFAYLENKLENKSYWVVTENVETIERVDSFSDDTRKRLGVIALASQAQANVDHENNPEKELAITPQTLANRVATEARRGIARIATTAQVNQITEFAFADDIIITPKKLNEKQATETMRGVAEIATQVETNAGTDDARIVTPKKLNDRKASETLTGILALTGTGVATKPNTVRGALDGVNVYKTDENTKAVTPKSLFENKATATAQGGVYLAIQSEVDAGQTQAGYPNAVVTPETLGARRATDANHGLIEIATQAETNAGTDYTRAVTPKTLNDRKATQDLSGIAEIATQDEFDAGTDDTRISTPLKIKTRFNDPARTSVSAAAGLVETGTLWDHYTLDIKEASELQRGTLKLATQLLTDAGVDDATAVTPLKLQKKKATESTEGIIQIATQPEVVAGTNGLKAVPPVHLKYIVQQEKTWEATIARRGFVQLSDGTATTKSDKVFGSGISFEPITGLYINDDVKLTAANYLKEGFAVSPYELNRTLQNFLPANAVAVDSHKLDNLDSTQFIRRDIAQTVEGSLTLTKETIVQAPITSSSSATFAGDVNSKTLTTAGPITIKNGTNQWKFNAPLDGTTLQIGDLTNVLTLNTTNGNAAVLGSLSAGADVSAKSNYNLNGKQVITTSADSLYFGNLTQDSVIRTKDASNIIAADGANYKVLTEKNVKEIVDRDFVKKEGDTMGGKLNINAPVLPKISEAQAMAPLTSANIGFWAAEITTPAIYQTLPGYAIPEFKQNEAGQDYVDSYTYKAAPGLMTCAGTSIDYIYRTWTPHPEAVVLNHNANTQWISIWDAARGVWGEWGRVFTNQAPPTALEIGAVSSAGSAFNNLTIRDWLQIGNVRIQPDPVTKSVKFTWIP